MALTKEQKQRLEKDKAAKKKKADNNELIRKSNGNAKF